MTSVRKLNNNLQSVPNPYSNRMPVIHPAQFYGRYDDILHVAQHIRDWQIFAISGEPRIGKTSFLYFLVHPDGARILPDFSAYIGDPMDYLFVLVELQRLPRRRGLEFWRYLFDRLVEEARREGIETEDMLAEYESSQESGSDSYEVQAGFESYLKQLKRKVALLFDDFDIVINDFERTEVIQVTDKLRTLKETPDLSSKLNYIIASTDPLVRLFEATAIVNPSALINIIIPAPPLGLLEQDAVDELIQDPLQTGGTIEQFTRDDIAFIKRLAGRHPDFLKISCYYLFEARRQGYVKYDDVQQSIENDAHLRWLMNGLWERMKQAEALEDLPLREVLLQVAHGQNPTNPRAFRDLLMRGLIDDSTSPPRIFADLFCSFILQPKLTAVEPDKPVFTSLESKLYSYLLEHAEQTCTRQELQKAIWGNKIPSSPDALEQLVKRVRKKIEANPEQPMYLLNVRGQGYLLRHGRQGT